MVTRVNRRFHLVKPPFVAVSLLSFLCAAIKKKNLRSVVLRSLIFCAEIPSPRHGLRNTSRTPFQNAGKPDQQICDHIAAICFVQHFVPSAWIKIVTNRCEPCAAIAVDQHTHSFQSLPDRIVTAGEDVNGEIVPYLPNLAWVSQSRESIDERLHRLWL